MVITLKLKFSVGDIVLFRSHPYTITKVNYVEIHAGDGLKSHGDIIDIEENQFFVVVEYECKNEYGTIRAFGHELTKT